MTHSKVSAVAFVVSSKSPPYSVMGSDQQNTGTHITDRELVEKLTKLLGVKQGEHGIFTVTFVPGNFPEL